MLESLKSGWTWMADDLLLMFVTLMYFTSGCFLLLRSSVSLFCWVMLEGMFRLLRAWDLCYHKERLASSQKFADLLVSLDTIKHSGLLFALRRLTIF